MPATRPAKTSFHPSDAQEVYANKGNIVRDDTYPPQDGAAGRVFVAQGQDRTVAAAGVVTLDDPPSNAVYRNGVASAAGLVDTDNLSAGLYKIKARVKSITATPAVGTRIALVLRNAADAGDTAVIALFAGGSECIFEGFVTAAANESIVLRADGATHTGVEVDLTVERA